MNKLLTIAGMFFALTLQACGGGVVSTNEEALDPLDSDTSAIRAAVIPGTYTLCQGSCRETWHNGKRIARHEFFNNVSSAVATYASNGMWQNTSVGSYRLEGGFDFNQDGNIDLIFRDSASGKIVIWTMRDGFRLKAFYLPSSGSYQIAAISRMGGHTQITFSNPAAPAGLRRADWMLDTNMVMAANYPVFY